MSTSCAPCLADLALVREAVTTVLGTAACTAHAVLLSHPHDTAQQRLARLTELRTQAEGKLATASEADQPALELLLQEYTLAGAMDMTVPLRELAGDRTPRPERGSRRGRGERGERPEGQRSERPEGQRGERGERPVRGERGERGRGGRGQRQGGEAPDGATAPASPSEVATSLPGVPEGAAPVDALTSANDSGFAAAGPRDDQQGPPLGGDPSPTGAPSSEAPAATTGWPQPATGALPPSSSSPDSLVGPATQAPSGDVGVADHTPHEPQVTPAPTSEGASGDPSSSSDAP